MRFRASPKFVRNFQFTVFVVLFLLCCDGYHLWTTREAAKQAVTFNQMRIIAYKLEDVRENAPAPLDETLANQIITSTSLKGRDAWNRPLIFSQRMGSNGHPEFVLISKGRDGEFEYPRIADYFNLSVEYVHGQPDRDLVFKNAEALRNGGK